MEENILVSIISIIVSGLVSLFISRHYYNKANKDMFLRILRPIVVGLVSEKFFPEQYYDELANLQKHVELMYLDKSDINVIIEMSDAICQYRKYSQNYAYAEAVVELFADRFEKEGIGLKYVPVTTPDGEIIDYEYVPEIQDLFLAVEKIMQEYDNRIYEEYWDDFNLAGTLRNQMNYTASLINYGIRFDDMDIFKEISMSKSIMKYEEKKKDLKNKINIFLDLKICQDIVRETA